MKRSIKYIITTIICVVMVCSLSLPAAAADTAYFPFSSVFVSRWVNNSMVGTVVSTLDNEPHSMTNDVVIAGYPGPYDQYINTDLVSSTDEVGYLQCFLTNDAFNSYEPKSNINYFEFDVGIIIRNGADINSIGNTVFNILVGDKNINNHLTISYTSSGPAQGTGGNGVIYTYQVLNVKCLLDSNYRFNDNDTVRFTFRSAILWGNASYYYSLGVNNLKVSYKTVDDFIQDTAKDTNEIKNTVIKISDSLSTELTDEQSAKLSENAQLIIEREEAEQEIMNEYSQIQDIIRDNGYDIYDNSNTAAVGDAEVLYSSSGVSVVASSFWESSFVVLAVGLVFTFIAVKIGIFGI